MTIRDLRQQEYVDVFMEKGHRGILLLSVRMGKTRVGLRILSNFLKAKALVCYPENSIKDSWTDEAEEIGVSLENVTFCNFRSLEKHIHEKWDVVIIDECHALSSEREIEHMKAILADCKAVLGLTGTLAPKSKSRLRNKLKLRVLGEYTTEQAIEDGIVADYVIRVHTVKLDNEHLVQFGKKFKTEKKHFDDYSWVIQKMENEGKDTMFMRINRMRILQASEAKVKYTSLLLQKYASERILVFCALERIAEQLNIPLQTAKKKTGNIAKFKEAEIDRLVVVDMGAMGVTFKPLNRVIVNYINSNSEDMFQRIARALNLEYAGKVAEIDIVCSTEPIELEWLRKALKQFIQTKIYYL